MSNTGYRKFDKHWFGVQLLMLFFAALPAWAQQPLEKKGDSVLVVAGAKYARSPFHNFLFGKHYREDWVTPVMMPVVYLDTLAGGVRPYETGGSRQTKTLKLHDKQGKEYVIRSIDKSYGQALPEIYRGSFVEALANDQVSSAEPYSALTIAGMAEAAQVYHTNPRIVYIPKQPRLDTLNDVAGNNLYLFEQRPDENWEEAGNFGNPKNIVGTEKVLRELLEDHDNQPDQIRYIRSRLFDLLIGDWGRHEDQWRWGVFKKDGETVFKPIPRDRDQAYTKFDGLLVRFANYGPLQTFGYTIKDIKTFNFAARNLDRRMTNEATLDDWRKEARRLQAAITDKVIEENVQKLPPPVYRLSGEEITARLKARRDRLHEYAEEYYRFLARETDIPGSEKNEYFKVSRLNNEETLVEVSGLSKSGNTPGKPFYSRVFKTGETKEVRLYGIGGNDIFDIEGHTGKGIKVRVIGGPGEDKITDHSFVDGTNQKTRVYDNPGNEITASPETKVRVSDDTAINAYKYDAFTYDKRGFSPLLYYNNADRIHIGIGYKMKKGKWRKEPYFYEQSIFLKYSLTQSAIGATYKGVFHQLIGKWDLEAIADYDAVRWTNFFGFGNETVSAATDRNFNRVRTNEILTSIGLNRDFNKHHQVKITPFLQSVKVIHDRTRFLEYTLVPDALHRYDRHFFAGGRIDYAYTNVNDIIIPTKGLGFFGAATYTHNLEQTNRALMRYDGTARLFVPLMKNLSLAITGSASTISGDAEFYQYPVIGGTRNFRGFIRERFRGNTSFYNNNELQWVKDVRSKIMNGKAGLIALADDGRVWYKGETSDKWHVSYGGGILLAPFNMVKATVAYAVSEDGGRFHIRLSRNINPYY